MEKKIVKLNYEDAVIIAKEYFIEASGLGADAENHKELLAEGLQVLENCRPGIDITAMIMPLDPGSFHDSIIFMGEKQFTCTAFHQISSDKVLGIFAYLLSPGKCESEIKNQADIMPISGVMDLWRQDAGF